MPDSDIDSAQGLTTVSLSPAQMAAFQQKVRAQVAPGNPDAATVLVRWAQAAIDGQKDNDLLEPALRPLWACWALLRKARQAFK